MELTEIVITLRLTESGDGIDLLSTVPIDEIDRQAKAGSSLALIALGAVHGVMDTERELQAIINETKG